MKFNDLKGSKILTNPSTYTLLLLAVFCMYNVYIFSIHRMLLFLTVFPFGLTRKVFSHLIKFKPINLQTDLIYSD